MEHADVVVVGAGAAGLMAATWAGRAAPGRSVLLLDGARRIGAKILVSGGGRCNVTHDTVDERDFSGSTPPAIRKVLGRFGVPETVEYFRRIGVPLKREEGGKLFPVSDSARTVLDALLGAAREAGVETSYPRRVEEVTPSADGFEVGGPWGRVRASRVVLATGGASLPKSGSDGFGFALARRLGIAVTPHVLPALVPLTLEGGCFLTRLPGVSARAALEVRSATGRRIFRREGALLLTHFGVSGPCVLDASRHYLVARRQDPATSLVVSFIPGLSVAALDAQLRDLGRRSPGRLLAERLPERLARALCEEAGVDPSIQGGTMSGDARRRLARCVVDLPLPVTGSRGFQHAEVTAGGIPLSELRLDTLEARARPGLHACGEILDVDGFVGGYNFQWAWASGRVAGEGAARALTPPATRAPRPG